MPEWTSPPEPDPNPYGSAESWMEALMVTSEYFKENTIFDALKGMQAPEPEQLHEAAIEVVAKRLTEQIMADPKAAKSLPRPELMLEMVMVGCLAGAVYAVSEMQEARLRVDEHTQPEENK